MAYMEEILREKREEYCPLIYLMEDFSHRFNLSIKDLAHFLLINEFYKYYYVYVNINKTDYVQLDKAISQKSISHLLNIFNDKKYNDSRLSIMEDDNIIELDHIHIKEDDLYSFTPLQELDFDYCIGYEVLGSVNLKNVDYKELKKAEIEHFNAQPDFFSEEWYALHPKLKEMRNMPVEEHKVATLFQHPSLDITNPNHAPELLLAIKAWEAKYLENEYPHQEHTPAITNILKNKNIIQVNLVKRICAITNPNK